MRNIANRCACQKGAQVHGNINAKLPCITSADHHQKLKARLLKKRKGRGRAVAKQRKRAMKTLVVQAKNDLVLRVLRTVMKLLSLPIKGIKIRAVKVNALIYEIIVAEINAIKYFKAVNATLFTSDVHDTNRCVPAVRNRRDRDGS